MSTNLIAVLQQLLQNTSNLKVLRERMTPDATYVSLNFDNPELKKVMPWTGTHKGPQELFDVFAAIQRYWKTLVSLAKIKSAFAMNNMQRRRVTCYSVDVKSRGVVANNRRPGASCLPSSRQPG